MRNHVRACRTAMGMTQSKLAEMSGVPASTISEIEHGAEPRVMTAICIARVLGFPVEELWPLPNEGQVGAEDPCY